MSCGFQIMKKFSITCIESCVDPCIRFDLTARAGHISALSEEQIYEIHGTQASCASNLACCKRTKTTLSGSSSSQSHFVCQRLFNASANGLCLKAGRTWLG